MSTTEQEPKFLLRTILLQNGNTVGLVQFDEHNWGVELFNKATECYTRFSLSNQALFALNLLYSNSDRPFGSVIEAPAMSEEQLTETPEEEKAKWSISNSSLAAAEQTPADSTES